MTTTPLAKPYLEVIAPYSGGKTAASKTGKNIKLSSNENPYGCSPHASEAFAACAHLLHRYPEDGCASLRTAIHKKFGFDPDQLICGAGSDEVIKMLIHTYAGPGDEVLYPEHGFLMYKIYAQQFGATPTTAPEKNLTTDVDALLAAVTPATRLVFLANPNNPTGSYISQHELHRLRSGLREDIILVVDGAYAEYAHLPDYSSGVELVATSNTVITRTFSKIYGLPALRIGWGYGPAHLIQALYKTRGPFNVTQPAIAAAIASLADDAFVRQSVARNAEQLARLNDAFAAFGLTVYPSYGNFVLVGFERAAKTAHECCTHLMSCGIAVREVANYGLPHCLRITIGTAEENDALLEALSAFLRS